MRQVGQQNWPAASASSSTRTRRRDVRRTQLAHRIVGFGETLPDVNLESSYQSGRLCKRPQGAQRGSKEVVATCRLHPLRHRQRSVWRHCCFARLEVLADDRITAIGCLWEVGRVRPPALNKLEAALNRRLITEEEQASILAIRYGSAARVRRLGWLKLLAVRAAAPQDAMAVRFGATRRLLIAWVALPDLLRSHSRLRERRLQLYLR